MTFLQDEWIAQFREIVLAYNRQRISDPFMEWFRLQDRLGLFTNNLERILAILIDARFDQQTLAENALENTKRVVQAGALKRPLERNEIPLLIPRQRMTAENWSELFSTGLPLLRRLAVQIERQQVWGADELLGLMRSSSYRVPYLGVKTSRLAVRWLHELVPHLQIDMSDFKVPVDVLVYRVASRLGIIDPHRDHYSGEGSPADVKIQLFAQKLFPDNPWFLDEPLWSTGRRVSDGGHCFPTRPSHRGCIFAEICPKKHLDVDPSEIGMESGQKTADRAISGYTRRDRSPEPTERQRRFNGFVQELKAKGITGEEYRHRITKWFKDNP